MDLRMRKRFLQRRESSELVDVHLVQILNYIHYFRSRIIQKREAVRDYKNFHKFK